MVLLRNPISVLQVCHLPLKLLLQCIHAALGIIMIMIIEIKLKIIEENEYIMYVALAEWFFKIAFTVLHIVYWSHGFGRGFIFKLNQVCAVHGAMQTVYTMMDKID